MMLNKLMNFYPTIADTVTEQMPKAAEGSAEPRLSVAYDELKSAFSAHADQQLPFELGTLLTNEAAPQTTVYFAGQITLPMIMLAKSMETHAADFANVTHNGLPISGLQLSITPPQPPQPPQPQELEAPATKPKTKGRKAKLAADPTASTSPIDTPSPATAPPRIDNEKIIEMTEHDYLKNKIYDLVRQLQSSTLTIEERFELNNKYQHATVLLLEEQKAALRDLALRKDVYDHKYRPSDVTEEEEEDEEKPMKSTLKLPPFDKARVISGDRTFGKFAAYAELKLEHSDKTHEIRQVVQRQTTTITYLRSIIGSLSLVHTLDDLEEFRKGHGLDVLESNRLARRESAKKAKERAAQVTSETMKVLPAKKRRPQFEAILSCAADDDDVNDNEEEEDNKTSEAEQQPRKKKSKTQE
jgi:hypothetical protein